MEDVEIERAVKSALEDGAGVNPEEMRRIIALAEREAKVRRERRWLWQGAVPALLAATAALAVVFRARASCGAKWTGLRSGVQGALRRRNFCWPGRRRPAEICSDLV